MLSRNSPTGGRVAAARFVGTLLPVAVLAALLAAPGAGTPRAVAAQTGTYTNPLRPTIPTGGIVESCADPTVFHGQQPGDRYWYMFCTSDPLNGQDRNASGGFNFHSIPMSRSLDLVHWTYVGDALQNPPAWADPGAGFWAPEVVYSTVYHQYYMFFVVTDTSTTAGGEPNCTGDSSIAVATSSGPTGPWTPSDAPTVAPRRAGPGCNFYWTYDPDVLGDALATSSTIYYGSYYGGIFARPVTLTQAGATTAAPETQITIANRYEGANVIARGGYYYLFASATNCCNGPLTGYSVFAGRSTSPLGPFVDREGTSLLAGRVGGSPVISMNGNEWVGTGHNTVFLDFSGQWWTVYHAVNRFDPYFAGAVGFTKRPPLLDPVDFVLGWPTVRGGRWASDTPQPAPAAQPNQSTAYQPSLAPQDSPGTPIGSASEEFNGTSLSPRWSWVRQPASTEYGVGGGTFRFNTQNADLYVDNNTASVLTEPAPVGDYLVEARVQLNVPAQGCCFNYVQAGLVIYGDDDNFVKLAHVSIFETRQTEWAKELSPVPAGYPRYGNTVVGPPSDWTYLRIVRRAIPAGTPAAGADTETYTAYTSQDGRAWVRGGTWTHHLGATARIGLVSMGGSGFVANVDYVRVYRPTSS